MHMGLALVSIKQRQGAAILALSEGVKEKDLLIPG